MALATNTSLEFVGLRSAIVIKICNSNNILNQFCSRESDEIANKIWVHRINQPPFDNGIVGAPFSKGWVGWRRLRKISIDVS